MNPAPQSQDRWRHDDEAGPARAGLWMGRSESDGCRRVPAGFLPLQAAKGEDVVMPPDTHALILGPTGCGKGVHSIIPTLLRHDGPAIVIDPKGEAAAVTARHRAEIGQDVVVLDPMGITSQTAGAFNPLDAIDVRSATAVDDAASLVQALMANAGPDARDRWWSQQAEHLLIGLVLHVLADLPPAERHLGSLRRLAERGLSDPKGLAAVMRESRHAEVRQIAHMLDLGADTTLGGIIAFAQSAVTFLRGELVIRAVSRTSFELGRVVEGAPLTIYMVLPPHMLQSHGRLLRAWLSALLGLITRRRRRPATNTLLVIDEAAALGELPHLRQALTVLRGYGLQAMTYWQDVAQLRQLYPSDWQTLANNCGVIQCFGSANLSAAEAICELVGWKDPLLAMSLGPGGHVIHQQRGQLPIVARLPDYRFDPALEGRWDPNPYFSQRGAFVHPAPRSDALDYLAPSQKAETMTVPDLMPLVARRRSRV